MNHATTLIVVTRDKIYRATLRRPWALCDIWAHYLARNKRPALVTLRKGVACVTF